MRPRSRRGATLHAGCPSNDSHAAPPRLPKGMPPHRMLSLPRVVGDEAGHLQVVGDGQRDFGRRMSGPSPLLVGIKNAVGCGPDLPAPKDAEASTPLAASNDPCGDLV